MGKANKKKKLKPFDKYFYYHASVQSPEEDVKFFNRAYRDFNGENAVSLREDFCGTFSVCCEWVKLSKGNQAIGVDIDPEPISYGREHYFAELNDNQKQRVKVTEQSVLDPNLPQAQVIAATNFSYFIFKERQVLKSYFENCLQSLPDGGILILDCFGGSQCAEANEEETEYDDLEFSYFWDQDSFDPIENHAQFYIHFKRKGEKKRKRVFSYDWRMWAIPELRDLLSEAGFKESAVYWEGTDKNGDGDGVFTRTHQGEECESWICYIVSQR